MIQKVTQEKLLHHYLNMDYPIEGLDKEKQTNILINWIMNDFVIKFEKDFKNKYIILQSENDTFTLIAYSILKGIQSFIPFQFLIYGKKKVFKNYLKKDIKENFISKRTFNKLQKINKAIIVNCYNPLYQVANHKKFYRKEQSNSQYNLIEKFTPDELAIARIFYKISWIKKDDIYFESKEAKEFNKFCNGGLINFDVLLKLFRTTNIPVRPYSINIVKLTKDNEKDNELLNEVANSNDLIFYYINDSIVNYPILESNYNFFLKNKSNIPSYWNINKYSIVQYIREHEQLESINFIGDFNNLEKEIWGGKNGK